jgi:hypothetical protein
MDQIKTPEVHAHRFPDPGKEPFALSEEEMLEAWGAFIPPQAENETSAIFEQVMGEYFHLRSEVWLKHLDGSSLRIDYVGFDKRKAIIEPIGFEVKRGRISEDDFSKFTQSIRQAVDYSRCVISDQRATVANGKPLRFVFLFPCPYQIYENDNNRWHTGYRDLWAQGVLKLASESGVGAMGQIPRKREWAMFLGGHPAWWKTAGFTDLALRHARARKLGSAA